MSYKTSKTQAQRRGQLFLVWKISFHMEFFDKPEHVLESKREHMSLHHLHTVIVFGL